MSAREPSPRADAATPKSAADIIKTLGRKPRSAKGRLRYLRNFLAALPPEMVDMSEVGTGPDMLHQCGSHACITGWHYALFPNDWLADAVPSHQYNELIMPTGWSRGANCYPQSVVIAVLDGLIETGTVDWEAARAKATDQ